MTNITQYDALNNKSKFDLESVLRQQMQDNGLSFDPGEPFQFTGVPVRFPKDTDHWYIGSYDDWGLIVTYTSWKASLSVHHVFKEWFNNVPIDREMQLKRLQDEQDQKKALKEAKEKQWKEMSDVCAQLYERCLVTPPNQEVLAYPKKKQIEPIGVKFSSYKDSNSVVIPIRDCNYKIWSLQYIFWNKEKGQFDKRFKRGGKRDGVFHVINDERIENGDKLYICEGWATGVSIYQAIKEPKTKVVVAMCLGNLISVIDDIKSNFNDCAYIIAADGGEDEIKAANKAAATFGCQVTYPECDKDKGKDFNDVHASRSLEEVKRQLLKTVSFETYIVRAQKHATSLLDREEPCDSFKINDLPDILKNHVTELCSSNAAHPLAVLGSLVTTASCAIGKRFFMEKGENEVDGFFSKLHCNIWTLFLAPSGQYKSTAMNLGSTYMRDHREKFYKLALPLKEQLAETFNQKDKYPLIKAIREIEKHNILFPDRSTPEALMESLSSGRAGGIFNSEFGGFMKELYKPNNIGLMALLTRIFDCDLVEDSTKTQGCNYIPTPFLSIYGVSTLAWIQDCLTVRDVQGGFFARFNIISLPERKEMPKMLPKKTTELKGTYGPFCDKLDGIKRNKQFQFTRKSADYYIAVATEIWKIQCSFKPEMRETLSPYINRWQASVVKIAMIMELFFDEYSCLVSEEAIQAAYSMVKPAIKSTISLFGNQLGVSEFELNCSKIFNFICLCAKKKEEVTSRTIQQFCNMKSKDVGEILQKLLDTGKIKRSEQSTAKKLVYELELD